MDSCKWLWNSFLFSIFLLLMTYMIDIYDAKGKVVEQVALPEGIFADHNINPTLMHEYVLLQQSNARQGNAKTKGRGEVAGSGRKLYKQKGTGNARAGGKDSPTRKWGGIAFGPRGEANYTKSMSKKARFLALAGMLTQRAQEWAICGLKDVSINTPKTKEAASIIKNIGLENKKALIVIADKDENIEKSFRNIDKVKYLRVDYLNPADVLGSDKIVFMESALAKLA